MLSEDRAQFLLTVLISIPFVLILLAMLLPPDPLTQVIGVAIATPVVLLVSYLLIYRFEFRWT